MIGAGSVVFSKNLTGDLLSFPEFRGATLAYMDVDADRLAVGAALCEKVAKSLGAKPRIEAHTDRRKALAGADFVINMVQVGGFDATLVDFEIPRKYGLTFTIADTTGPGGLFRALRTFPVLTSLCREMEQVCPRAVLLNYSNPMAMNMQAVFRTSGVRAVGLCHSVQCTFDLLAKYLGEDPAKLAFTCAGVNHMAFFLRLEKDGVDLYPRLFEAMDTRPEIYADNKVRFELMRRLGYFVTESSEHSAEYSPWFIPHGRDVIAKYDIPIDEYLRRCDANVDEFERLRGVAKSDDPLGPVHRSPEYGSTIVHAMATGRPAVVYGNRPNRGSITNLPDDAIVEVATVVDRAGLRPTVVGALPPQLAAYMHPHVTQAELFIRAATEGRRDHVYQAAMFDPLTAATLPPDRIVELCDELIAAHGFVDKGGGTLPPMDTVKTLVPSGGRIFPRVDAAGLRASWDTAQAAAADEFVQFWHVIGPFRSPHEGVISLEMRTPVDDEMARRPDGALDLKATFGWGESALAWRKVSASRRTGVVNLVAELGRCEWCCAYGYAEIESDAERDVTLRCGSDDGIRVWLNGRQVHSNEARRPYTAHADAVQVKLRTGTNRLLVKVDNARFDWAFGVAVSK